jgi:hypothetical protein
MRSPYPTGYLSYGSLNHVRRHVCPDCKTEHTNSSGIADRCSACAEKTKAVRRAKYNADFYRRQKARRVIAEVIGI